MLRKRGAIYCALAIDLYQKNKGDSTLYRLQIKKEQIENILVFGMFGRIKRRVISLWFPRLASERFLRSQFADGPVVLTLKENNSNRIYCLNTIAERQGLKLGMSYSDARVFCPNLKSYPANPRADTQFLYVLRRWATRYCPWVGIEGSDGLVLDVTGSAHLMGGEAALLMDMRQRLARARLSVKIGLADTRGAAWALAHFGEGVAEAGNTLSALQNLPVSALRLDDATIISLQRLGLKCIKDLVAAERAPLARRFGPEVLRRLDQALGDQPEEITPLSLPHHYGVRMTLPEPIGLAADVLAGTSRLLERLCAKLKDQEMGARVLSLTLRRVDQDSQQVTLRLARPLRDAHRILHLFERGVGAIDSGFGIDQIRIEATQVEPLPIYQVSHVPESGCDALDDLITRIGTRIGLENVYRFLPADSHIPERSFTISPAAFCEAEGGWAWHRPRPVSLFPPEPIFAQGTQPPKYFKWRRMSLTTHYTVGPERILPEWWLSDEAWRSGMRDYWFVQTQQGWRLWLFYTPQNPGWFIQGVFA